MFKCMVCKKSLRWDDSKYICDICMKEKKEDIKPLKVDVDCVSSDLIKNNIWENLKDIGEAVVACLKNKKWSWVYNSRCKYVSIRIDMRSGKCILLNDSNKRITIEELKYQWTPLEI